MPPSRKPPKVTETQEHLRIAGHLKKYGLADGAVMIHLRGERAGAMQRAIAGRMGVISGVPDWLIVGKGRTGFIELKERGWKSRRERFGNYTAHEWRQLDMHDQLRCAGAWVEVCETLDEVIGTLARHGIEVNAISRANVLIEAGAARAAE
jgi:hypothetical protein